MDESAERGYGQAGSESAAGRTPPGGNDARGASAEERREGLERRSGPPRGSGADGREQDRVVVLLPPEEGRPTWLRRGIVWGALLVILAATAWWAHEAGFLGTFENGFVVDPGDGQVGSRPESSGNVEGATGIEESDPTATDEASLRFRRAADSLERSVDGYGVRRSDFERDRIGCATLSSGYREVDRRFVDLSLMVRENRGDLDAGAVRRYRQLTSEVDEVNRHFDGSGCRASR